MGVVSPVKFVSYFLSVQVISSVVKARGTEKCGTRIWEPRGLGLLGTQQIRQRYPRGLLCLLGPSVTLLYQIFAMLHYS